MSDSNLASVAFQRETTWGQTPLPPALQLLRFTKESLEHEKATETSSEIRSDRQRSESVQTGVDAKGGFDFELSVGSFDSFLEAALMGAWADGATYTGGTAGVSTLRNGVARYSYTLEKQLLPGSFISFAGLMLNTLALNFASRKIVTASAGFLGRKGDEHATSIQSRKLGTLTFAANGTDAATITVGGKVYTLQAVLTAGDGHVKIGATTAATVANLVAAINADLALKGSGYAAATVVNPEVSAQVGGVAGTVLVIEKFTGATDVALASTDGNATWGGANLATAQAAYTAAATGLILSASVNVGNILEGGAVVSGLKNLSLTVNNNLRGNDEIGRIDVGEIGLGECAVSGKVDAYFRDRALLTKFIQHTASSLSFEVSRVAPGAAGGDPIGYRFTIPALRWTKGMPTATGKNTDVMLPLEFEAEVGASGYTIQVEKLVLP